MKYKHKGREKEYKKEYREKNKERIKKQGKEYRQRHEVKKMRKKYYETNKENISKQKQGYYQKHKEERKKYYETNKERILKQKKEYYHKNKEKELLRNRKYRTNNKEKMKKKRIDHYQKNKNNPEFIEKRKKQSKEYNKKNREELLRKGRESYWKNRNKNLTQMNEYHKKRVEEENNRRKKLGLSLVGEGFKSEMELLIYIHKIFLNYDILTHHRKPLMDWRPKGLELDIYIPELKLAFEYMGRQHYEFIEFFHKTQEEFGYRQYRDRCKKRICKLKGITLIKIKYDEKLSEQLILSKLKYIPSLISVQENLK